MEIKPGIYNRSSIKLKPFFSQSCNTISGHCPNITYSSPSDSLCSPLFLLCSPSPVPQPPRRKEFGDLPSQRTQLLLSSFDFLQRVTVNTPPARVSLQF